MKRWYLSLPIVLALLLPSCCLGRSMSLDYLCRYNCYYFIEHLAGVAAISPTRALVASYLGVGLIDLTALPVDGSSAALSRVPGLDARNLYLCGNYVFVNLHAHGGYSTYGFAVIRIDGDKLTLIKVVSEPGVFYEKMCIKGEYLYVAAHSKGIRIYNIANPENPLLIGSLKTGFTDAFAIDVQGNTAYVADGPCGLKLVDVKKPRAPSIIWTESPESITGTAEAVSVKGNSVYVALGSGGLGIYDRQSPSRKDVLKIGNLVEDMSWIGKYLAIAHLNGLSILDPNGPNGPEVVASERTTLRGEQGSSLRICYDLCPLGDDRLLVANWDNVDMYQLKDIRQSTQPNIDCDLQRMRFPVTGGTQEAVIRNTGNGVLTIKEISCSSPDYSVSLRKDTPDYKPVSLPDGVNCMQLKRGDGMVLTVSCSGTDKTGVVRVVSDDPDESPLGIQLYCRTPYLDPGEQAIDFTLPLLKRNPVTGGFEQSLFTLSDCRGKVVYLCICASWCPACFPTIADIQNSVLKEFEGNPNVVALFYHEGGRQGESTPGWMETVWDNYYCRGSFIWDVTGANSIQNYSMPNASIPFFRNYVIDQEGVVKLALFGYDPEFVEKTIYDLLK